MSTRQEIINLLSVPDGGLVPGKGIVRALKYLVENTPELPAVITEHGTSNYGSLGMMVLGGEFERDYPLADWIDNERAAGRKIYRRTVFVIEDWTEVTTADDSA